MTDGSEPRESGTAITLPGSDPFDPTLRGHLAEALAAKGPSYQPRTHHLLPGGAPKYTNRLILETSPYLLQHAHNPVSWFPWGAEAFERAKQLGRPVLLSVGYSTCHWCHVMEAESFEDEEIAAFINANYVPIKVDREERPDVDSVYMSAVQALTGGGGWPMTVVMGHDKRPFFGGTYFPPRDGARGPRTTGFLTILQRLAQVYREKPQDVAQSAAQISRMLERSAAPAAPAGMPGKDVLVRAAAALAARFDSEHGGFGGAPKFPRPATFEIMLRYWRRTADPVALEIVTRSLDRMRDGGIYDQVAGGFHRYSTDAEWLVPHFEKMLYDNAQLVAIYLETFQATGEGRYADTARETLAYVAREMTSPEGGFYSATDADSEGHEGLFFVWTPEEITEALGPERAKIVAAYYGVTARGNFEGKNILNRPRPEAEVAKSLGLELGKLHEEIAAAKTKLYAVREKRIPPLRDDKILTEWNGQMISAFARGAEVLDDAGLLEHARRAADFVLGKLTKDGRLLRAYRDGRAKHAAVLEDYAFFIAGLLDLFEASGERRWIDQALAFEAKLEELFLDAEGGGFYGTPKDGELLLVREKPSYDGAQPSGNSVAALNLLRLHELTGRDHFRGIAEKTLLALGGTLEGGGLAAPKLATALDYYYDKPREIVIVSPKGVSPKPLLDALRRSYVPNRARVVVEEGPAIEALAAVIPLVAEKRALKGQPTAYVCTKGVCLAPATTPQALAAELATAEPLGLSVDKLRIRR